MNFRQLAVIEKRDFLIEDLNWTLLTKTRLLENTKTRGTIK